MAMTKTTREGDVRAWQKQHDSPKTNRKKGKEKKKEDQGIAVP